MTERRRRLSAAYLARTALAATVGFISLVAISSDASAMKFKSGDFDISVDTTLSATAMIRTSQRNCALISATNSQGCANDGLTDNYDDGNLNFDQWDVFSAPLGGLTEIEVKSGDFGAFVRGSYFVDGVLWDKESTRRTDLSDSAVHHIGRRARLLDAYVYGVVPTGDMPISLRVGNQVLNWGESVFYGGGIAETNSYDMTKLRGAGAEIKQAFLPAPMVLAQFSPFENVDVSAYYQWHWNETEYDPVGTFFSIEDVFGPGHQGVFYGPALGGVGDPGASGLSPAAQFALGTGIPDAAEGRPRNSGQWGASARYFSDALQTEFGAYYMRYHQKAPVLGVNAACDPVFGCYPVSYFREFVEDQNLYGATASFVLQDVSVGVEVAYQPNYSVPLADASTAAAGAALALDPVGFTGTAHELGFTRANRTQMILNGIYVAPPTMPILGSLIQAAGMNDLTFMAETAWTHFDNKPFNTFGDKNAIGYVLDITGSYQGIFGTPWVLYPGLAFKHDVKGTALDYVVTDTHIAGRKTLTLRLTADYQSTWSVGIAYVNNFGAGDMNFNSDRDYASATISYAF
ncbi:MAG TPA: DUF1302 domain-containing protein [Parvibaculum sp.]|jgi:hypothetical protein